MPEIRDITSIPDTKRGLIEILAEIEHERWSAWQKWMHSQGERQEDGSLVIPAHLVERWERQMSTPYKDLSSEEQASDKIQVYRYWPWVRAFFERRGADPMLE